MSQKQQDTAIDSFEALADALDEVSDQHMETVEKDLGDNVLTLHGNIFSIVIHDQAFAHDTYMVTKLLQILASGYQGAKISAEDIISSIEDQAKKNLEEGNLGEDGEVEGLTAKQEMLMAKLEDSLDIISYLFEDLKTNFDQHNDNPENKLFYTTDQERRKMKSKFKNERNEEEMAAQKQIIEMARAQREERRKARETRTAA